MRRHTGSKKPNGRLGHHRPDRGSPETFEARESKFRGSREPRRILLLGFSKHRVIYPRSDGVWFLESFGTKEDSDAPQVPPEVRHQVIELARSGTKVAQLAVTFGMSDATIYNWLKQDKVDRGEIAGLSTEEALDLAARSAGSSSSRPSWPFRARSTRSSSKETCPQKALPGDRLPDRAGDQRPPRLSRARGLGVGLLRLEGPAGPAADLAADLAGGGDRRRPQGLRRHLRRDAG